jgi:hypothetical protein
MNSVQQEWRKRVEGKGLGIPAEGRWARGRRHRRTRQPVQPRQGSVRERRSARAPWPPERMGLGPPREGARTPKHMSTKGGSADVGRGRRRGRWGGTAVVVEVAGENPSRHVHGKRRCVHRARRRTGGWRRTEGGRARRRYGTEAVEVGHGGGGSSGAEFWHPTSVKEGMRAQDLAKTKPSMPSYLYTEGHL